MVIMTVIMKFIILIVVLVLSIVKGYQYNALKYHHLLNHHHLIHHRHHHHHHLNHLYHHHHHHHKRISLTLSNNNNNNNNNINNNNNDNEYLSTNMIQSLSSLPSLLSPLSLDQWENVLNNAINDIKPIKSKDILLNIYSSLLSIVSIIENDPLTITAFNNMINIIIDNILSNYNKDEPITLLIDDITDIHLKYIDIFSNIINDGGSDGYSQSSKQEFLCYQFAYLIRYIYDRLNKNLGSNYDMSNSVQDLRLNSWVTPVYARLQRRFVRFLASNVDDKMEEMTSTSFDKILEKVNIDVTPRYLLSNIAISEPNSIYAPWNLASFIIKMLRNTLTSSSSSEYMSIEAKVASKYQNVLAYKMRGIGKSLEKVFYDNLSVNKPLNEKEIGQVEEMINIGHCVVSAVLTIWHIRHNIVGVPDSEGKTVKDFIMPIALGKRESTLAGIPKNMRDVIVLDEEDSFARLRPSPLLESATILANAVRSSASDDFRALITYNSDPDELPRSRDTIFKSVMTYLLTQVIINPKYDEKTFYENLLSLVALEEAIGVREPRTSCAESYQVALQNAVSILFKDKGASAVDLDDRVKDIEKALGLISRLPEDSGYQVRVKAFKGCIDTIMIEGEKSGRFALKDVENEYPWIAKMLLIDENVAKKYVSPLGQNIFDKTIGQILMNADLTLSMTNFGDMFVKQLETLASDVLMSQEAAEERTMLLAGAVFQSIIETSLEENKRMNEDRAESLLQKAYTMYRHPLLVHLQNKYSDKNLLDVGIKMVTARLGASGIMDLLRYLDTTRSKLSGSNTASSSGWGSSSPSALSKDPQYLSFLETLQVSFLKEYSSGGIKRGYSSR